jgi:hypothetical protein
MVIGRRLGRDPGDRGQIIAAFGGLFDRAARDLGLMIGPKGINAVLQRALHIARPRQPPLLMVGVNDDGLHLESLEGSESDCTAIADALAELFIITMEVMASLIGYDLVAPIIRRMENLTETKVQTEP